MFLDAFATPDGRARFVPVEHRPVAEDLDAEYPVYFTTGRVLQHYQSGAQTRRVRALRRNGRLAGGGCWGIRGRVLGRPPSRSR